MKKKTSPILCLLGTSIYAPITDDRYTIVAGGIGVVVQPDVMAEAVADWCRQNKHKSIFLVAEPEGIEHHVVDNLATVSAAKLRGTLPQMARDQVDLASGSEICGWSAEEPWPAGSMRRTIVHQETTTLIRTIQDRLTMEGIEIRSATAWYSVAGRLMAALGVSPAAPAIAIMICEAGAYFAITSPTQRRIASFISRDNVVSEMRTMLEDLGLVQAEWNTNVGQPTFGIFDLDGQISDLLNQAIPERIQRKNFTQDQIAAALAKCGKHQDLADAFPRPLNISAALMGAGVLAFFASIALVGLTFLGAQKGEASRAATQSSFAEMETRISQGNALRTELKAVEAAMNDSALVVPRGQIGALESLARARPKTFTFSTFEMDEKGVFKLGAILVAAPSHDAAEADAANFRTNLVAAGFRITDWQFEQATTGDGADSQIAPRNLRAIGRWEKTQDVSVAGIAAMKLAEADSKAIAEKAAVAAAQVEGPVQVAKPLSAEEVELQLLEQAKIQKRTYRRRLPNGDIELRRPPNYEAVIVKPEAQTPDGPDAASPAVPDLPTGPSGRPGGRPPGAPAAP